MNCAFNLESGHELNKIRPGCSWLMKNMWLTCWGTDGALVLIIMTSACIILSTGGKHQDCTNPSNHHDLSQSPVVSCQHHPSSPEWEKVRPGQTQLLPLPVGKAFDVREQIKGVSELLTSSCRLWHQCVSVSSQRGHHTVHVLGIHRIHRLLFPTSLLLILHFLLRFKLITLIVFKQQLKSKIL